MDVALTWKKRSQGDLPTWSRKPSKAGSRITLPKLKLGGDGPGLMFFLVALVVVAVAGARFLGFSPDFSGGSGLPVAGERIETPAAPWIVSDEDGSLGLQGTRSQGAGDLQGTGQTDAPLTLPVAGDDARGPRVIVYHAHGSENYRPHAPHARGGRPGDIVQVGAVLADGLRAEGFVVEHLTEAFDHPQWSEAFARAGEALARLLDEHRDVAAVIDVHRDATADDVAPTLLRARVGDAEAAKVLFVIGEADNPYAERNAAFAEALKRRVDGQLPGLSRGVRLHTNNYNGHLHPRSVQLFIGDYEKTTLEQAKETARLLAPVIAAVLRENPR